MPSSRCFCHSMDKLKPFSLATPHSREKLMLSSAWEWVRSSMSSPTWMSSGTMSACQISNHHTSRTLLPLEKGPSFLRRCGINTNVSARCNLSCRNICTTWRTFGCKKHVCKSVCHGGECNRCEVRDMAWRWCGKDSAAINSVSGS